MSEGLAVDDLRTLLGSERVSEDADDLDAHAHDWSPEALLKRRTGERFEQPEVVVRPTTTDEVVALLQWAHERRVSVVPFGAGSGVVSGLRPGRAVVVDLTAMSRVVELDATSGLITVQAGVTGPALRETLAREGLMLGHEPQSHDISTVGGWVATKACGQLSARYGGIESLVAGLEAVLPGGRVMSSKVVPRRSAGPDVTSLMIGSEGTLGIITEVTLRVAAIPEDRTDLCVRFEHMADGVAACRRIAASDLHPTVVRLYDVDDASLFLRAHPEEPPGPLLLLSFDGFDPVARADAALELSEGSEGNQELVEHWWEHRNDAVAEFRKLLDGAGLLGPHGIVETMEMSASWSRLRDLYHDTKEALSGEADFVGCHLSHIYPDGACLYFTMGSACASDEDAAVALERWWTVGMSTCIGVGGSISHHHGIGRRKAAWMEDEWGGWLDVMRALKAAIDPHGIMNPGVLGL